MPMPKLPLTPLSSAEIAGQDKPSSPFTSEGLPLQLPPPAVPSSATKTSRRAAVAGNSNRQQQQAKDARPASPQDEAAPERKRRRSSMVAVGSTPTGAGPSYSLPPPPTRSRTIIQMQPGASKTPKVQEKRKQEREIRAEGTATSKAPGASTASGKRLARKTAHSVIERRRRSKMNEEFDTMKDMIPACKGQTMHKLAILQAGIDYLRYLEQCVTDLNAANGQTSPELAAAVAKAPQATTPRQLDDMDEEDEEDEDEDDEDNDEGKDDQPMVDDEDDEVVTPRTDTAPRRPATADSYSFSTPSSPRFGVRLAQQLSRSSAGTSVQPSPVLTGYDRERYIHSADASPALGPNASRDADYEATAALLMLTGDRSSSSNKNGRGLSVQDLLSG